MPSPAARDSGRRRHDVDADEGASHGRRDLTPEPEVGRVDGGADCVAEAKQPSHMLALSTSKLRRM